MPPPIRVVRSLVPAFHAATSQSRGGLYSRWMLLQDRYDLGESWGNKCISNPAVCFIYKFNCEMECPSRTSDNNNYKKTLLFALRLSDR